MYCLADAVTQGSLKGTETGNGGTKYVETSLYEDGLKVKHFFTEISHADPGSKVWDNYMFLNAFYSVSMHNSHADSKEAP